MSAASIKPPAGDSMKEDLKAALPSSAFAEHAWRDRRGEKKGLLRTAAGAAARGAEAAAGQGGTAGGIDSRAKGLAQKYGYKAGKYALRGGFSAVRGAVRLGRYGKRLSADAAAGLLTGGEARKLFAGRAARSLTGSGKTAGGILKAGTFRVIEDFKGSDDLGMKAITKPKDAAVKAARLWKTAGSPVRAVPKAFRAVKKAAQKIQGGSRAVLALGKKLLSNPAALKAAALAAPAAAALASAVSTVASIAGILQPLSLKSEDHELSQAYLYVTELDARMTDDIVHEDARLHAPAIDVYRYYVNGAEVPKDRIEAYTDADRILAYLDSLHGDYTFSGVKDEIRAIHGQLHQVEKTAWTEQAEQESDPADPEAGEAAAGTGTHSVRHMDICLTTQTWDAYYGASKDALLTPEQQEQYEALKETGAYTFRQELSSPFRGTDWSPHVTSRWGWRIHPVSGDLAQHTGLDIAMPEGTPVNACSSGTAETGYDAGGWGIYVKAVMENGDYTLYGHLSAAAVSAGQQVKAGDVVGYVGTTGASTGSHLHLEYHKDGRNLNPLIFTECEKTEP
jgi:murein DD-endopeptidase MepM/ murein hydrolase activator NlpD